MNYKSGVVLVIFCSILVSLWLNSSCWFRLKLIDYYKDKGQPKKVIQLYNKILRRNNIKEELNNETFVEIYFGLGFLYAGFNLSNLAIESYARGSEKSVEAVIGSYYQRDDFKQDRLIAIGLLEAGKSKAAINELQRLKRIYPNFENAEKYISVADALLTMDLAVDDEFYFKLGDAYIQYGLFDEARNFFAKRILYYGINPIQMLTYLHQNYSESREVIRRVWGDDIYVTLEDFEVLNPQLIQWVSKIKVKVNRHSIVDRVAYKGNRSEFLDISSMEKGRDLWVKIVNISLDDMSFDLGVRAFIRSKKPSPHSLRFNVKYPRCHESGVSSGSEGRELGGGWREYRIENLGERARRIALRRGWNTERMFVDKVILDTQGVSNQFYIDDVELYLVD